jgi:catechol 2,3-dioxygenase-like lactoylglutathione lyase family enzyme
MRLPGLHHITAIASNAKRNVDFYTRVLGLRLVKKTVNFDDPGTYHRSNSWPRPNPIRVFPRRIRRCRREKGSTVFTA